MRYLEMAFQAFEQRNHWLIRQLGLYAGCRCWMALAGLTPTHSLQQLRMLNDLERMHS
jgi:hypothetical protein